VAFIEGEVKEVSSCTVVSGRSGAYSVGISLKGRGCHFGRLTKWQHYYSIIPPFFNMRVGPEDQGLGCEASISLATSCWQGALYGAGSSGSCILVGILIAVFWMVLERLISMEVKLDKLLISHSRHVVLYKGGSLRIGQQET
jgi:hypothetical protein